MPQVGFYSDEGEKLVSVTSCIDYTLGVADEIDKWITKQAILAVQKASKTQKLTQETAIKLGLDARHQILDKSRFRGSQVHQAIQNLHNNLPYELEEEDTPYFEAYFNFYKQHSIKPILEEFKIINHKHGYAGRLDFYGWLDGKRVLLDFKTSNSIRWTYGLQLAAYRQWLEDAGYPVDDMYIVHIKPKKRGTNPMAELHRFTTPFKMFEHLLALFRHKLAHDPYVKWYERTDEAAIEKDLSAEANRSPQGLHPDNQELSQNSVEPTKEQQTEAIQHAYSYPEEQSNSSPSGSESPLVEQTETSHKATQPQGHASRTSSRIVEIPPGDTPLTSLEPGVVVRFASTRGYRTPLEISPLPSAKDISVEAELDVDHLAAPELAWDSELDSPQSDHQKTA